MTTSGVGRPLEIMFFFSSKVLRENGTERKDWIEFISLILTRLLYGDEVYHWLFPAEQVKQGSYAHARWQISCFTDSFFAIQNARV